jgi:quinol monooxygenase YgiN
MSIALTLRMQTKPDQGDAFAQFLADLGVSTRATDDGCEIYEAFRSLDDPTRFALVESWTTQEALDAHNAAPHMATTRDTLRDLTEILVHRHVD